VCLCECNSPPPPQEPVFFLPPSKSVCVCVDGISCAPLSLFLGRWPPHNAMYQIIRLQMAIGFVCFIYYVVFCQKACVCTPSSAKMKTHASSCLSPHRPLCWHGAKRERETGFSPPIPQQQQCSSSAAAHRHHPVHAQPGHGAAATRPYPVPPRGHLASDCRPHQVNLRHADHPDAHGYKELSLNPHGPWRYHAPSIDEYTSWQPGLISRCEQVAHLATSAASKPALTFAVNAFYNANPTMATQTFDGLATALTNAARNSISLTPAQMGSSVMAPRASALAAAVLSDSALAAETGRPRHAPAGAPRNPAAPAAPHAPRPPRNNKEHCWFHGDCGHPGSICDKKDTPGFQVNATKANPGTKAVGDWAMVRLTKKA
jgi:hypothetical protein